MNIRLISIVIGLLVFFIESISADELTSFKEYFRSAPAIDPIVAKWEYGGTDIWYTATSYQDGNFVCRRERNLTDLTKRRFTSNTHIAGRNGDQYWYCDRSGGPLVTIVDDVSRLSTNSARGFHEIALGAYNTVAAYSINGLDSVYFGLPIWNAKSAIWEDNTIKAEAPMNLIVEGTVLSHTNGLPLKMRAVYKRQMSPQSAVGDTNILFYYFGKSFDSDQFPMPRTIEIWNNDESRLLSKISFLDCKIKLGVVPIVRWDFREYLSSSVTELRFMTNNTDLRRPYDDNKEGYTRVAGIRIRNAIYPTLLLIGIALLTGCIFIMAKFARRWSLGVTSPIRESQK